MKFATIQHIKYLFLRMARGSILIILIFLSSLRKLINVTVKLNFLELGLILYKKAFRSARNTTSHTMVGKETGYRLWNELRKYPVEMFFIKLDCFVEANGATSQ